VRETARLEARRTVSAHAPAVLSSKPAATHAKTKETAQAPATGWDPLLVRHVQTGLVPFSRESRVFFSQNQQSLQGKMWAVAGGAAVGAALIGVLGRIARLAARLPT
jgi:hypothetical protein